MVLSKGALSAVVILGAVVLVQSSLGIAEFVRLKNRKDCKADKRAWNICGVEILFLLIGAAMLGYGAYAAVKGDYKSSNSVLNDKVEQAQRANAQAQQALYSAVGQPRAIPKDAIAAPARSYK